MKRIMGQCICCCVLLTLLFAAVVLPVYAASCTLLDGAITVLDNVGNLSLSGSTVTAKATGGSWGGTQTNTITITNSSDSAAQIMFNWSATKTGGTMTCTVDGTTANSGAFTKNMAANESVTISLYAKGSTFSSQTATLTLSDFSYNAVSASYGVTIDINGSGTVTLDGTSITDGTTSDISALNGAALIATPSSGYSFLGWIDTSDNKLLSTSASYTITPAADMTVKAIFVNKTSDAAWFMAGGNYLYNDLNTAAAEAATLTNKTVVLMNNATLPAGEYTIPNNVTLLIPYAESSAAYTAPLTDPEREVESSANPTLFRKLAVESGATINCLGNIRVDARQSSLSTQYSGRLYGAYGQIVLNEGATLNMNSGSTLRAYGYITGAGVVNTTGATIYELFQMSDWRGGNNTSSLYQGLVDESFLVSQFYVQNIEAKLVMDADTTLVTLVTVAAGLVSKDEYSNPMELIGSDGLFRMSSGTTITRTYSSTGRIQYSINGNLTVGSINLQVKSSLAAIELDSADYVLNLPSNMTIKIESGNTSFPIRAKLLPGTILEVGSNAVVTMSSGAELIAYDYDDWTSGNYTYSGTFFAVPYAVTGRMTGLAANVSGQLIVNGTLNVENGAAIYSTSKASYNTNGNPGLSGTGVIAFGTAPSTVRTTIEEVSGSSSNTETVAVVPVQALLSGLSNSNTDYTNSMSYSSTYHGTSSKYWYQWKVTTKTVDADGNAVEGGAIDITGDMEGYIVNGGTFAVTVPEGYDLVEVTTSSGTLTNTDSTYTLSGASADPTITITVKGKCEHQWVDATCTAPKTCSVCDATEGEAKGHSYASVVTAPTCTEKGYTTHTCSACGYSYTDSETAALGHSYTSEVTTEPTCTTAGVRTYSCSCGDSYTEEVAALGHSYNAGEVTNAPTCTATGVKTYTCATCGGTKTEEIAATGHTVVTDAAVEATCTDEGKTEGSHCSACNEVLVAQEDVPAKGHTEEAVPGKDATCTETGLTSGKKCSTCGETLTAQEVIPATGHAYETVVTAPTCTEAGYTTYTCTTCGDTYTDDETAATGHTEVTDAAVAATCTETGLTEGKHCSVCNEIIVAQEEVAALGHTEVTDAAVAPTCTETGKTEGKHCSVCNEVLVAQTEVAALGHTEVTDAAVAATCTTTGLTEGKHCSVCSEVLVAQTEVAALGHTEVIDAAVTPTCTATGLTEGKHCSACDEVLVAQTEVAATGHTEVTDAAVAATCTATGLTEGKHCTVCNEIIVAQETVAALGHTEVTDEAVAPTCTETGKTEGKHCDLCNEVLVAQTEVAALGHTEVPDAAVAATCTATGLTEGKHCSVCNEIIVAQETVAALGHTEVTDAAVAATCTTTGLTEGKHCSVCNEIIVAQETVAAAGHSYNGGVVTAQPTCTVAGVKTFTCSCGDTYTEEVAALGHDMVAVEGKAATCTEDGYTAYKDCSRCDHIEDKEVIPAGHTIAQGAAQEKTCTQDGWDAYEYCTECDYSTKVVIPAGHSFTNYVASGDLETAKCDNCDETDTRIVENATGEDDQAITLVPDAGSSGEDETASNSAQVTVSTGLLGDIAKDGLELHLNSELLELVFDNGALNKILTDHDGKSKVSIVVENTTPEETTDKLVFDIHLTVDGEKQESSDFGEGEVTVTIPLDKLGNLTEKQTVKVWHVERDENGNEKRTLMEDGFNHDRENRKVQFKTNHFSEYEVEVVNEETEETTTPTVAVTDPANGTTITHSIVEAESGWTLTLTAADTANTYVYLVKYTDADGNVSEKVANADGKYSDGSFAIPEGTTAVTVQSALAGDANLDGKINAKDVGLARQYVAKIATLDEIQFTAADVNQDNKVNAKDVGLLRQYVAKVVTKF